MEKIKRGEKNREGIFFVYVTCPSQEASRFIAEKCLEKKWVACANIFPEIESFYRWKGKLEKEKESVLVLKTKESYLSSLKDYIVSLHKYECPCVLFFEAKGGNQPFIRWILSSTE